MEEEPTLGEVYRRLKEFEKEIKADLAENYARTEHHLANFVDSINSNINEKDKFLLFRIQAVENRLGTLERGIEDQNRSRQQGRMAIGGAVVAAVISAGGAVTAAIVAVTVH